MIVSQKLCYNVEVPSKYKTEGSADTDLLIIVSADNRPDESYIAYATSCMSDFKTGRPVVGLVNFNIAKINRDVGSFEDNVDTTMHEIIHVLGMSPNLYDNFIDEYGNSR